MYQRNLTTNAPVEQQRQAILKIGGLALAQGQSGSIAGVVKDQSGAVIAGANVSATSLADGGRRTVETNDQGFFLIPTLQPGEYKVYCPIGSHSVKGMSVKLVVTATQGG